MPVTFLDPSWLLLVLLLVPIMVAWNLLQRTVSHSRVGMQSDLRGFSVAAKLPKILFATAWILLTIARAQPALTHVSEQTTVDTRDIIVAVDMSGSMGSGISASGGATPDWCKLYGCAAGENGTPNKQDLARHAVKEFITLRPGDRIELLQFDDNVYYSWPLSSDQKALLEKADDINTIGGGTNFDGPAPDASQLGPIQAAINDFQNHSDAKTRIFVMVTDGGSTIDPGRMVYFLKEFARLNVHVYVLGVGDDWTGNSSDTQDLRNLVAQAHGVIVNAGSAQELDKGIATISNLEKSSVKIQRDTLYRDIYQPFLFAGIVVLLLYLALNAVTRRAS